MVARVNTVAFQGIEVIGVDVQVQIAPGLPAFSIVGLPDKAVAESRERVRGALNALGLALPPKRITVNLAPADLAKEGSHFDLPIALGLLAAMEVLPAEDMAGFVAIGELSLDGRISAVAGALPAAIHAHGTGCGLICPAACGGEAAWVKGLEILAAPSLMELINHFKGSQVLSPPEPKSESATGAGPDLADIKGQETARRAPGCAADYQGKISGPLFDRIDLHVDVPAVEAADLSLPPPAEGSCEVARRVAAARAIQRGRFEELDQPLRTNAEADGAVLEKIAAPDEAGRTLLTEAAEKMRLSARGYHRVLRVARTLADLDGGAGVRRMHIAEAVSYRRLMPGR